MQIFIDESGTFTPKSGPAAISVVGALIVPEGKMTFIERKYQSIRNALPTDRGEVKGRLLSEQHVDRVVTMLAKNEVLFEVVAIDMAMHSRAQVEKHKAGQEAALTANLTDEFHPNLQKSVWELRHRLERMPHQLYAQSVVTFELIATVIRLSTLYFSQRHPKTLGQFQWVVDAKDRQSVTDWESWWAFTVMPMIQSRSFREPLSRLIGGDYSYFQRFETDIPRYLYPHLNDPTKRTGLDGKKIMTESFRFSSDPEPGLEMVDILTNATRRALMGNLRQAGWENIPRLMIDRRDQYIELISLDESQSQSSHRCPYLDVIHHFRSGGKNILAPRFAKCD